MYRLREHVYTLDLLYSVSRLMQCFKIVYETGRFAGNIDYIFHSEVYDLGKSFRINTLTGRIEHNDIRLIRYLINTF